MKIFYTQAKIDQKNSRIAYLEVIRIRFLYNYHQNFANFKIKIK